MHSNRSEPDRRAPAQGERAAADPSAGGPGPLLLETGPRHVTAEELFQEARTAGIPVSLATVYNTLHQFTAAGLMTEVVAGSGQSYFDTNPTSHYHYFDKSTGEIIDVPEDAIQFRACPSRRRAR